MLGVRDIENVFCFFFFSNDNRYRDPWSIRLADFHATRGLVLSKNFRGIVKHRQWNINTNKDAYILPFDFGWKKLCAKTFQNATFEGRYPQVGKTFLSCAPAIPRDRNKFYCRLVLILNHAVSVSVGE